jgi:hypothetical protein
MEKLADVLYHPEYLKKFNDYRITSEFICSQLSKENLKRISDEGLFYTIQRCDPILATKLSKVEVMITKFGLDELLFGKSAFEKRLGEVAKLLNITDWDIAPLLFFTAPKYFFLPSEAMIRYCETRLKRNALNNSFYLFNAALSDYFGKSIEKKAFATPMEFSAAVVTYENERKSEETLIDNEDQKMLEEMVQSLKRIDLYRIETPLINWIKELYFSLTIEQQNAFREKALFEGVHPLLRRLVSEKHTNGVVIDGSNIIRAGLFQPDPNRLKMLLNVIGAYSPLFFPIYYVFDANADYLITSHREYWEKNFLNNPNVLFFSPADETIIKTAYERHYAIISNDRYRDYAPLTVKVLSFQPEKGKLYLQ